jgi:hypothetical protein
MNLKIGSASRSALAIILAFALLSIHAKETSPKKASEKAPEKPPTNTDSEDFMTPEELRIKDKVTKRLALKNKKKPKPMCLPSLVQSYGMEGLNSPRKVNLDLCPQIKKSCCSREDQIVMFGLISADMKNLKRRNYMYSEILNNIYKELLKIEDVVERMHERQKKRGISNCKILATKLVHYRISGIIPKLKQRIEEMHNFMVTSYKGFYCTICDANQHRFLDPALKLMYFKRSFCRKIVENTLHSMLYLHDNFVRYLRLMVKFATNCDAMGRFDPQPLTENLTLRFNKNSKSTRKCWKNRNEPEWAANCMQYCRNFKPVEISAFYEPYINKFIYITEVLRTRRSFFEHQEQHEALLNLPENYEDPKKVNSQNSHHGHQVRKDRILTDIGARNAASNKVKETNGKSTNSTNSSNSTSSNGTKADEEEEDDEFDFSSARLQIILKRSNKREVISHAVGASFDLTKFQVVFQTTGVDYYSTGKETIANKDIVMRLMDEIDKKRHPEDYERMLSSVERVSTVIGLIVFALVNMF